MANLALKKQSDTPWVPARLRARNISDKGAAIKRHRSITGI
jgi:hypothetical protein